MELLTHTHYKNMSTILEFGIVQNDTLFYGTSVSGTFSKLVVLRCRIPYSTTSALIHLIELSRTDLLLLCSDSCFLQILNFLIFLFPQILVWQKREMRKPKEGKSLMKTCPTKKCPLKTCPMSYKKPHNSKTPCAH